MSLEFAVMRLPTNVSRYLPRLPQTSFACHRELFGLQQWLCGQVQSMAQTMSYLTVANGHAFTLPISIAPHFPPLSIRLIILVAGNKIVDRTSQVMRRRIASAKRHGIAHANVLLPRDLFTPLFTVCRVRHFCEALRLECGLRK